MQKPELVINGIYEHYKGGRYRVLGTCRHSETLEELVLYECLYENEIGRLWVRPKKMFLESVMKKSRETPRFRFTGTTS